MTEAAEMTPREGRAAKFAALREKVLNLRAERRSLGDIAAILGITKGSAEGMLERARKAGDPRALGGAMRPGGWHETKRAVAETHRGQVAQAMLMTGTNKATAFRTVGEKVALEAAIGRALRMTALPPVSESEADRLVREAIAAGKVTRCPPACAAGVSVNNGEGFE
jgi:hypothetical protein